MHRYPHKPDRGLSHLISHDGLSHTNGRSDHPHPHLCTYDKLFLPLHRGHQPILTNPSAVLCSSPSNSALYSRYVFLYSIVCSIPILLYFCFHEILFQYIRKELSCQLSMPYPVSFFSEVCVVFNP